MSNQSEGEITSPEAPVAPDVPDTSAAPWVIQWKGLNGHAPRLTSQGNDTLPARLSNPIQAAVSWAKAVGLKSSDSDHWPIKVNVFRSTEPSAAVTVKLNCFFSDVEGEWFYVALKSTD